jgi:hypothetical protein
VGVWIETTEIPQGLFVAVVAPGVARELKLKNG